MYYIDGRIYQAILLKILHESFTICTRNFCGGFTVESKIYGATVWLWFDIYIYPHIEVSCDLKYFNYISKFNLFFIKVILHFSLSNKILNVCAYNYFIVRTSLYSHVDLNLTFNCHTILYILYFIPKTKNNEQATVFFFLRKNVNQCPHLISLIMVML